MNNTFDFIELSPFVGNPSPEADRGIAISESDLYFDIDLKPQDFRKAYCQDMRNLLQRRFVSAKFKDELSIAVSTWKLEKNRHVGQPDSVQEPIFEITEEQRNTLTSKQLYRLKRHIHRKTNGLIGQTHSACETLKEACETSPVPAHSQDESRVHRANTCFRPSGRFEPYLHDRLLARRKSSRARNKKFRDMSIPDNELPRWALAARNKKRAFYRAKDLVINPQCGDLSLVDKAKSFFIFNKDCTRFCKLPVLGIVEQGGLPLPNYHKLVNEAKLVQRLSDHNLGGGLGKSKKLNRLISQGKLERHNSYKHKKKCPVSVKELNDHKSSMVARSVLLKDARDSKSMRILPQAFGLGMPEVPVGVTAETAELIEELTEVIKNKKIEVSDDVRASLDSLTAAISAANNVTVKHGLDIKSLFSGIGGSVAPGLALVLTIVFVATTKSKFAVKVLAGIIAASIMFVGDLSQQARQCFDRIVDWAKSFIDGRDEDEEIVWNEQGLNTLVVDSIIGFMYYSHAKSVSWDKDPLTKLSNFFNRTRDMRKIKDGVEFTFSIVLSYVQTFVDWICEVFGWKAYDISMDKRPEIVLYAEKVVVVLKQFSEGRILNSESAKDVNDLYTEGSKIAKSLPSSPEYVDSRRLLQTTMSELNPLILKIRRSNLCNSGPRIQPVGVFLTGPPGVGKSTAMTPMMVEITARTIDLDQVPAFQVNHNDFIYNRITENVFWDSYRGQYNVVMDDLGQTADVKGVNNNPYMEFIRMVNSNAMDLHMAHLDDKGVTGFRAKFVWATSNVNKFRLESIINPGALTRRFTCSYIVVPAVGYREDETENDFWKMKLKPGVPFLEGYPHLDFYDYDALVGKVLSNSPIKMAEVVEQILRAHHFNQAFGQQVLDLHDRVKNDALLKRKDINIEDLGVKRQSGDEVERELSAKRLPAFGLGETIQGYFARNKDVNFDDRDFFTPTLWHGAKSVAFSISEDICEAVTKIGGYLSLYQSSVYQHYKKITCAVSALSYADVIKKVLSGLAVFTAGYGLFSMLTDVEDPQDQGSDYLHQRLGPRPTRQRHRKPFRNSLIKNSKPKGLKVQLAFDATCDDIMYKIFKKNVYTLHRTVNSDKIGSVTFIGGHDAFMPRHFAENLLARIQDKLMSPEDKVVLRSATNPDNFFEFAFKDIHWYFDDKWAKQDVCFARFPNVLPQAPNIRKYIMDDSELITKQFSGKMLRPDKKGVLSIPFTDMHPVSDLPYTGYVNPHGFSYAIPTKVGDCGNLIFLSNPLSGVSKLIGYHTAGAEDHGLGFGVRISKSYIDSFDDFMKDTENVVYDIQAFDVPYTVDEVQPRSFKTLFKGRKANVPTSTSIVPSPLHNTFAPSKCAPAKMRAFTDDFGREIDPWLNARAKYSKSSLYMCQMTLDQCAISYGSKISNVSSNDVPWDRRVFTFEEAVRGIPGVPNCEGVPRGTSSGYPFCLDVPSGHKGKSHFFGKGDEYEFTSPHCLDLKKRVTNIVYEAGKGNRLTHIYFDFLKDERRPFEKIAKGSTRMISASPIDLLIATRMYFMDFVRWYMNNRIVNGSAVGINVFSTEWEVLRHHFSQDNPDHENLIAGDFQAYDACLSRQIQVRFLDFVNHWYSDGNDLIRAVLFEDVCNSKHIYNDTVYEWSGGNPSGCFLTTIVNTFCNNVILRYAGILCYDEFHYGPGLNVVSDVATVSLVLTMMEIQLFIQAYGDDNMVAVGGGLSEWYNQRSLTRNFAKFGFTYTSEDKTEEVAPLRRLADVSFLKRQWKYDPIVSRYVAALSLDTILEMVQWTKKNDKDYNNVKTTVDTCLKELSAHGQEIWDQYSGPILESSRKNLNYVPPIANRRHALELQLSRDSDSQ